MTPISRTLNEMAYKARQETRKAHGKSKKTTVINYGNVEFASCKDLAVMTTWL